MQTFSLQSGSSGNCIFVEAGGVRLLLDAGISGRQAQQRLTAVGQDPRRVDALIVSHDHSDHVRCAGIYSRKFGIPLYMTHATHAAASRRIGPVSEVRHFTAGETLDLGGMQVHTLATPHDAVDGVAFVVEGEGKRVGVLTDLGHAFAALASCLETLDGVYLESNYDPDMLEEGWYPRPLKERIRGRAGHISNQEAAQLIGQLPDGNLRWLVLAHLSENNNRPEVALETHRAIHGLRVPTYVASRHEPSPVLRL